MTQPRTPRYRIQRITEPNDNSSHWVVQRKGLFRWKTETEEEECTHERYPTYISVDKLFCSLDDARQYVARAQRGPIREVVWESPVAPKKEWSQGARLALCALSSLLLCAASFALYPSFFCVVSLFLALVVFVLGLWQ